jgi:hypothetical protein
MKRSLQLLNKSLLLSAASISVSPLEASVQINWNLPNTPSLNHVLSDHSPLPDGFTFQIGSFENGFIPTLINSADW